MRAAVCHRNRRGRPAFRADLKRTAADANHPIDSAKPATAKPGAPPRSIQLSPSERAALDEAAERTDKAAAAADNGLAPTADDIKPRSDSGLNTTRIEQTRTSNRITEVIVTPAGQTHSYVMVNREFRMPYGTTQMNSGLSVPMFFRFEFGKPTPATNLPPPPSPSR